MAFGDLETHRFRHKRGHRCLSHAYLYGRTGYIRWWLAQSSTDSILLAILARVLKVPLGIPGIPTSLILWVLVSISEKQDYSSFCLVEEPSWADLYQHQQPSSFFKAEFIWNICKSNGAFLGLLMVVYLVSWLEKKHWITCMVNLKKIILFNNYTEVISNT